MDDTGFRIETLTDETVKSLKSNEVAAIAYSEGGAMGEAGVISVFYLRDEEIIAAKANWVSRQIDFNRIERKFNFLDEKNPDWCCIYMGCGHLLSVNISEYPELAKRFEGMYEDEVGMCHRDSIYKCLKNRVSEKDNEKRK